VNDPSPDRADDLTWERSPEGVREPARHLTNANLHDRRGRGMRGPAFGPGAPAGRVPAHRTGRERFDQVAVDVMSDVESRWADELAPVELAVEDIPVLPQTWVAPRVPLASLVPATASTPPRLVLFRRPIEHRADTRADLEALVLTVVVEQLADFLGVPAEDVHPDYEP
jgi:predicted Zn-dependent protease with MMP-like domain